MLHPRLEASRALQGRRGRTRVCVCVKERERERERVPVCPGGLKLTPAAALGLCETTWEYL